MLNIGLTSKKESKFHLCCFFNRREKELHKIGKEPIEFTNCKDIKAFKDLCFDSLSIFSIDNRLYRILNQYTGFGFLRMNGVERRIQKNIDDERVQKKNDILSHALQKHTVKKDIIAYRGIEKSSLISMLGVRRNEELELLLTKKSPRGLVGRVLKDRGFISTSLLRSGVLCMSDCILKIHIPKGTFGVYIAEASSKPWEREVLIDRNQAFVITSIYMDKKPFFRKAPYIIDCNLLPKVR